MKRILCLVLSLFLVLPFVSCAKKAVDDDPQNSTTPENGSTEQTPTPAAAPADYSSVYAALAKVPADASLYTKASFQKVTDAINAIKYGKSKEEQSVVDACAQAILDAVNALEKKPVFSSYQEIIDYVDGLGIDFDDLASFDMSPYFEDTILTETEDAGQEYLDATYYIGDSLTLYLARTCSMPKSNVYGVGSINPETAVKNKNVTLKNGSKGTFAEAMGEIKPERVIITIGTNSMVMYSIDYITYFGQLIDDIRAATPETVIIIQSTPPLTAEYEKNMTRLTNRNINRSNLLLAGLASYKGAYYLNTAEALKDENGQLDVKFDLGEGYGHINPDAYVVWENYMRTHAVPK